MHVALFNYFLD
jgi:cysteine synthase